MHQVYVPSLDVGTHPIPDFQNQIVDAFGIDPGSVLRNSTDDVSRRSLLCQSPGRDRKKPIAPEASGPEGPEASLIFSRHETDKFLSGPN
jgi:hypothetical protein